MGVNFKETKYVGSKQPFWRGESKVLPGGFNITNKLPIGTFIPRGTFVKVNFDKLEATIIKYVVLVGGGTASKPRIPKGSLLCKGDVVVKSGGEEVKITDIDTDDTTFDTITLSKPIQNLKEGDILYEPTNIPEFVVESDKTVDDIKDTTVSISYEAVILKSVLGSFPDEWKEGHYLKENHNILFINQ